MKKLIWKLVFVGLILLEAGILLGGMVFAFPKWKAAALAPVCVGAWVDWGRDPHGNHWQTGRTGFQSAAPTLWVAIGATAGFFYMLVNTV